MLARAGRVRRAASGPAGELVDQLEVVLLRLDMLEADDAAAAEAFKELLRAADVDARVEAVLAGGDHPAVVTAWLSEAGFILGGVEHES
jgi:hypothetical protein